MRQRICPYKRRVKWLAAGLEERDPAHRPDLQKRAPRMRPKHTV